MPSAERWTTTGLLEYFMQVHRQMADRAFAFPDATRMAFRQFSDLARGDLFVHARVLHVNTEPLGPLNAVVLTGPRRGTGATFDDTAFVDSVTPREARFREDLVDRAEAKSPPNFHPDFHPTALGEGYFGGPDGFAYAFGAITRHIQTERAELQGATAFVQLDALGLGEQFRRGQTAHALPATFY